MKYLYFLRQQFLEPILALPYKEELTDEEVLNCRQIIYNLVGFEARNEPLTLPVSGHRLKGNKKEDQYRLLWTELELLLETGPRSAGHNAILQCVRECRSEDRLCFVEKCEADASAEALRGDSTKWASIIKATTDSPMSPPGTNAELINLTKAKAIFFPNNGTRYSINVSISS